MNARGIFCEIVKQEKLDITATHTRGMGPKIFKYYKGKIGG